MLLLFLQLSSLNAFAQERTVKGVVRDAKGEAIPGVGVKLKNSQTVTVTSPEGQFSIKIPSTRTSPVLLFSYVGFQDQEVNIGASSIYTVTLLEGNANLDKVVVIGYGTAKKEILTGSIATVSAKSFQDKGALPSPLQALQGQVPGAFITLSLSAPGDEAWSIQLKEVPVL